jgi:hypothetical protein
MHPYRPGNFVRAHHTCLDDNPRDPGRVHSRV